MAAPSIPNLATFKRGGGLRNLRGPRHTPSQDVSSDANTSSTRAAAAHDLTIQQTDTDASTSRMSAVALGYLSDPFARPFISGQIPKRYPLINRGTYVRTTAIDRLVLRFLGTDPGRRKQVVSLGAGSDTRYWRLEECNGVEYWELDFETNVRAKIAIIERSAAMQSVLRDRTTAQGQSDGIRVNAEKTQLECGNYHLQSIDLRDLVTPDSHPSPSRSTNETATPPPPQPVPTLSLDPTIPTLLLSECCLCYIPPHLTTSILRTLLSTHLHPSTPASLILYEPIRPHDAFGRTMIANLASRGIHLATLKRYGTLAAQRIRMNEVGLVDGSGARDVESLYYGVGDEEWVFADERRRVEAVEWLDEVEEWRLLGRHYCVAWGWRDGDGVDGGVFGRAWGGVPGGWTQGERGDDEVG